MTKNPEWVPIEAVIDLHDELIDKYGGAPGIRDMGLLESAVSRPQQLFAYSHNPGMTIFDLAAAYIWGLLRNHPFIDGNKRIALVTGGAFLRLNGCYLDAKEQNAFDVITRCSESTMTEFDLAAWIADQAFDS